MKTNIVMLFIASVAMGALGIGQAQAGTIDVPNGEFNVYKPGTNATVLATFAGAADSFESFAQGLGDNLTLLGDTAMADYADSTTGTTVDFPGWVNIQGNNDLSNNGVGGSTGLNVFAAWGGDFRCESAVSLGALQDGTYTLSAMVNGPVAAGPLAFDLMAGGVALTPSSSVDPVSGVLAGPFEVISRTYDAAAVAAFLGQPMTIVIGVQNANDLDNRAVFDNVTLEGPVPPGPIVPSNVFAVADTTFTLTADFPVGALDYQWSDQTGDLTDVGNISGSTTNVLTFNPLAEGDAGNYTVTYDDGETKTVVSTSFVLFVYPSGTTLPLTGLLGLGLLASACAMGGASVLRRKK